MKRIMWAAGLSLVLIAGGGAAAVYFLNREPRAYDPSFDATVAAPAYREQGPVVVFDEGHRNAHLTSTGYQPLVSLIRNDGYDVRAHGGAITAETLADASVLIINAPRGGNEANDGPAFEAAEEDAIVAWVERGGGLLLATDHWPFGVAAARLSRRFGVEVGGGMTADPAHYEAGLGDTHIVYSRENGLLGDHPVTNGRNESERIGRVLLFTGQSLSVPERAVAFLRLGEHAVDYPPTAPRIERDGGDTRVSMTYGAPVPARGRAQGLAFAFGAGRVVMLGEAGMLRAQRDGRGRVGMNYPGYDNRQLALNIMHWLSRLT